MPTPYIIFCCDPLNPRQTDPAFADEVTHAREAGFAITRLDHDDLDQRIDIQSALRFARFDDSAIAIYRGWMMSALAYAELYNTLLERGVTLQTSPQQYAACHHAPDSYTAVAKWMPEMTWVNIDAMDDERQVKDALKPFGTGGVIIKDWVKSHASGYWNEACYLPDATDLNAVKKSISKFRELQGDSLTGGIVFKAYRPLLPVGRPAYEYRSFVVKGRSIGCWPRDEATETLSPPPADLIDSVAAQIPSPFATADFGCDEAGNWWLLEIGDGQVSGLPRPVVAMSLFPALAAALNS